MAVLDDDGKLLQGFQYQYKDQPATSIKSIPWIVLLKNIICLAVLTLSWNLAQGQNVNQKNLTWYSNLCTENHSGIQFESKVKIVVTGDDLVHLIIDDQPIAFDIASVAGTWGNKNTDGTLEYVLVYNGSGHGKMIISRHSGAATISIDFTESGPDGIDYDFVIDRVEAN
jgi:hypothetical protein